MHINHIDVVVGGQYGSEGKGAVAAALADERQYDVFIRVAGPNAGHSAIGHDGFKHALRQIPVAAVRDHKATLYIAAGSEVELSVLQGEILELKDHGIPVEGRLHVHPEATIIQAHHHGRESEATRFGEFGSTRKGIGAARADRLMRQARRAIDFAEDLERMGAWVCEPHNAYHGMLEGTQGYWLGSHAGLYPYCTSSDCRAIDFLAMYGGTWNTAQAIVVMRSFPIRIAGNSGPLERETTWEAIGVPPEFTTVTKKMRRVGYWEPNRVAAAIRGNRVGTNDPAVAMTFMDYLSHVEAVQRELALDLIGGLADVVYVGNGPDTGFWL